MSSVPERPGVARLLPVLVIIAGVAASLWLWNSLHQRELLNSQHHASVRAATLNLTIGKELRARQRALERMAGRWQDRDGTPEEEWRRDAGRYVDSYEDDPRTILAWLDPDGMPRWLVVGHEQHGSALAAILRNPPLPDLLERVRASASPHFGAPVEGVLPGSWLPLAVGLEDGQGQSDGYLIGLFPLQSLLSRLFADEVIGDFAATVSTDAGTVYRHQTDLLSGNAAWHQTTVDLAGGQQWQIRAAMLPNDTGQWQNPHIVLLLGVMLTALLAATIHFALLARGREVRAGRLATRRGEELEATEQRYRDVIDASPSALIMVDPDGRIVLVNRAVESLFGYRREELLGESVEQLVPESVRGNHHAYRQEYFANPQPRMMGQGRDLYGRSKDGKEIPIEVGLTPIRMPDGDYVLSAIIDLTYRKQAERELARKAVEIERTEHRYREVVNASPSAMVMVDQGGCISLVNQAAERLFGYGRDDLIGQPVEILMPRAMRERHVGYREKFFQAPEPRAMGQGRDLYGLSRSGREIPIEVGLTPIDMPDGTHVLSAVIDLSHRKQAEEALARQADELARSNAELEQFAYVASHDLQEPLRMVRSYTELMEKRLAPELDEKMQRAMKYVIEGAERMQRLISDLLLYSRVGRGNLELADVDTNAVVSHVVSVLGPTLMEQPGSRVTWDDLPIVCASESMLVQVFQNLITNGVKFRAEEQPVAVHVSCDERDDHWCFAVRDNGIGIDPKYTERVFQVFQRLHERERYPGTGIGLALTRRIVERHGGAIWFESEVGVGTRFFFTLPKDPDIEEGPSHA